jgi:hypothetical protein
VGAGGSAMTGRWVAASLDAYGTPQGLDAEPRHDVPELAQAAAAERAFTLARRGWDVQRRPDGSWRLDHPHLDEPPLRRIVVFEATGPATAPPPAVRRTARQPVTTPPLHCGSYRPGHQVHYIQARKAREDHGEGTPCRLVAIRAPDVLMIEVDGTVEQWHNHQLGRLRDTRRRRGRLPRLYAAKRLLMLGTYCFCIATPEEWQPDCGSGPNNGFLFRPTFERGEDDA